MITVTAHPVFVIFFIISALVFGCAILAVIIGVVVDLFKPARLAMQALRRRSRQRMILCEAIEELFQAVRSGNNETIAKAQENLFHINRSL